MYFSFHHRFRLLAGMLFTAGMCITGIVRGTASAQVPDQPVEQELVLEPPSDTTRTESSGLPPGDDAPIEKMPEVITREKPVYPEDAARQGIEGTVVLECLLNDSGIVDSVRVISGVHPQLDSSAAAALRKFRFSPAKAGGIPVPVLLQYEVPFTLHTFTERVEKYINFQGILRERGTRTPIADAMVVLTFPDTVTDTALDVPFSRYLEKLGTFEGQYTEEKNLVTVTDSMGRFSFYSLPSCSISVSSPLTGYEPITEKELITPGEVLDVTYFARRVTYNDYEVVVYGKAEEKEVTRRQLTLAEARKIPGIGNDAVRVVQALPGVGRPSFGGGDIIVRGAPSWDSEYLLDGTIIPLLYHFGGLKSIYNSEALESVDFYPGGWSTRYGGAIAGIIEIKGRPAKSDRWHGQLDLNLIDGYLMVEGPVTKKISVMASARRSFVGDIVKWYTEQFPDRFPYSVSPSYYDILARADVTFTKNNTLFVTLLHSRDSLGIYVPGMQGGSSEVSEATQSLGTKIQFTTGLLGWDWKFTPRLANSLRYSFTNAQSDVSVFGYVTVNEHPYMHHIRDELAVTISPQVQLATGADVHLTIENLALQIPSGDGSINRDTTNNWLFGVVGAYALLTVKPTESLQLQPGIRYDYYPELIHRGGVVPEYWGYISFNNNRGYSGDPSFRLSGRYSINEQQTIKAAIGNYNQTPEPMGQTIHQTWGDPSLPTTKASHYLVGYEWRITDLISADLQCYLNRQWEIPRMASSEDLRDNPNALWLSDGKGKMKGLELLLRHDNNGRFFGWIAYTLSRSERWNPNEKQWVLYNDDETHHLQLLASWHLPHEWDVGTRIRYVTGKPTTPVLRVVENENYNYLMPVYGKENSSRVDPFFQIDLRVDKKFVYKNWMFSTYLDIQNLSWLFYKSPEMEIWNYDYTQKQTVSMIIQPAMGIRAEF
ncbi:MAG: TonB family protein [Chitinispirillaceae bacterium]|nr:TonB family protein [Chitinispirillaceae bacterium]